MIVDPQRWHIGVTLPGAFGLDGGSLVVSAFLTADDDDVRFGFSAGSTMFGAPPELVAETIAANTAYDVAEAGALASVLAAAVVALRGYVRGGLVDPAGAERAILPDPEQQRCEWFLTCHRPAVGTSPHPVLGAVPVCVECARRLGLDVEAYR